MTNTDAHRRSRLTAAGAARVPQVGVAFWVIKALSTAMGESTSDYLVHAMLPQLAVLLGFTAFLVALVLQFRQGRYVAWSYWLAVAAVGVFGTMAADVLHVALHVPYTASATLYAVVLAAVFFLWWKTEGTLSIHSIDTPRREMFYWAAVASTFAMGTALGDFTAYTLKLGYFPSAVMFAAIIAVPAVAYALLRRHEVLLFWLAYVVTRPLGASTADGLGKPKDVSGLGLGNGAVALVLAGLIVVMVAYLSLTRADLQAGAGSELGLETEGA
jgi:uncharacterized membrane-anchored protein